MASPQITSPSTRFGAEDLRGLALVYVQAIWRRRWLAAIVSWLVCIAGWTGIMFLPNKFESSARLYVNADTLLQPLLRGIALEQDPANQVEYLQRTLLSRPNLEQLVHLADMDAKAKTPADKEALLRSLASDVKISQQTTSLFTISYGDVSPITAKNVVQGMITIFSEAAAGSSRTEMNNAQNFLTTQISKYEAQLKAAEERRAAFREKYADVLPEVANGGGRLEATRGAVRQAQLQLNDATARRDSLKRELANVPQMLTVDQAASVIITNGTPTPTTVQQQLQEAQHRLDQLLLHFTEKHPDVVSTRREIANLHGQAESEKKGGGSGGSGNAGARKATVSNPVYEQMKLRLADSETTVASLTEALQAAQAQEKRTQDLVHQAPDIELQAQNLDRDYDVLKRNYQELVSRRESTQITEAADTQADRIQFRIIDAPQVPLKPSAPNRPLLYSGVLLVGLAGGVAVAFLLTQLDRSFPTLTKLKTLAVPILGGVSVIYRIDRHRRHVAQLTGFGVSILLLLVVYGALELVSLKLFPGVS